MISRSVQPQVIGGISCAINFSNLRASVTSDFDSKADELVNLLKKIEVQDQQAVVL